ncbi:MAG TPA: segregation/condensation protein A [Polyangiaceae bacterium]
MSQDEKFESASQAWSLKLPQFEGPLDLLLHLCQKHELNVVDIPIGFITEKYLEFLAVMQLMQLDLAAEYLVMAATLAHIKSRMLLPVPPPDPDAGQGDDEDELDPREALIRRLLEYQKYKQAAEDLAARGVSGRDVFGRGMPAQSLVGGPGAEAPPGLPPLAEVPLYSLVEAFQRVLDRTKIRLSHAVVADRISLSDRIGELADLLNARGRMSFDDTFDSVATKFDLVITFLALLEMTRLKMVRLFQSEPFAPMYVELSAATPAEVPEPAREDGETR